jgi:hypothetical protein
VFFIKIELKTICNLTKNLFTVPESEKFDPTTKSTLAQLLDIDSQLSAREAQLRSQLESLQRKRQSIQDVIALFGETDKTDVANDLKETISSTRAQNEKQPESVKENLAVSKTSANKSPSVAPSVSASTKGKKTTASASKKSQTKKTKTSKATKQSPGWQQYLREDFRNSSLPQAIASVVQSEVERVWDISSVTEAIFVPHIPQAVKKKVRLQITNLLAQGARENKWYRGQQGSYSLSKEAAISQNR